MKKKRSGMLGNAISMKTEAEWQAEDDLRALTRAKEIQADPKRMAAVKEMAKKKLEEVAAIAGAAA